MVTVRATQYQAIKALIDIVLVVLSMHEVQAQPMQTLASPSLIAIFESREHCGSLSRRDRITL